jgi:hypothetical protein
LAPCLRPFFLIVPRPVPSTLAGSGGISSGPVEDAAGRPDGAAEPRPPVAEVAAPGGPLAAAVPVGPQRQEARRAGVAVRPPAGSRRLGDAAAARPAWPPAAAG